MTRREALRERLRAPRRLRPTRAGWCFFGITFCVGFAAMNTGNNLLYLVQSLLLAFLVLSGLLSEAALRGVEVRRTLPRAVHAGGSASVCLEIANAQPRFPAFALVVEDVLVARPSERPGPGARVASSAPRRAGETAGEVFALRIDAGGLQSRRYALRPERRGDLHFAGVRVATRFPFGLFSKERWLELPAALLVYPALDPVWAGRPRARGEETTEGRAHAQAGGVLGGPLREFEHGDGLRRIHWPSTLRRARLHVRETEDEASAEVEVRLRTRGATAGEAFERAVTLAASEVVARLEAGLRVALRTDSQCEAGASGARQRARLLALLARVQPEPASSGEPVRMSEPADLQRGTAPDRDAESDEHRDREPGSADQAASQAGPADARGRAA